MANPRKEKEKEKEKNKQLTPTQEKKKKVKRWSKVAAVGPLYVFNYNIVIELWVIKTENSQKLFSVSITRNSKSRELSDGNRVMETELLFAKQTFAMGPTIFELWVMKTDNWVMKIDYSNTLLMIEYPWRRRWEGKQVLQLDQ